MNENKKGFPVPHVYVILLTLIAVCSLLSYVIPAGQYDMMTVGGREVVDASTYHAVASTPVTLMQMLSAGTKSVALTIDLSDCKDTVTLLFFLPLSASGTHKLGFKAANGGKDITVPLYAGYTNVIPVSTNEIKKSDGTASLTFTTTGTSVTACNATMCVISHTAVINH